MQRFRIARLACMALLLAALGGCATTTTTTTRTPEGPSTDTRAAAGADAERRAQVRMELAAENFARGRYDTALEEIRQALAAKPDMAAAFNLRGLSYAALGNNDLAEDSFARAQSLDPSDGDTMHNRGWFYCQLRRYADAVRLFDSALVQTTYRAQVRTHLAKGVCLAQWNKLPEAEISLTRAFELDPGDPTITLNLAEVLFRRGELERARQHIRRVNAKEEFVNAQTLWLALRIEHRLGNEPAMNEFGRQLRNRFPQSQEAQALERGQFSG
jgi:type IV pilus assembly protein PilF